MIFREFSYFRYDQNENMAFTITTTAQDILIGGVLKMFLEKDESLT